MSVKFNGWVILVLSVLFMVAGLHAILLGGFWGILSGLPTASVGLTIIVMTLRAVFGAKR